MITETPTLSSRTRHTSTKKRSSCCVGAFTMYSPSGADGSANTKQGCNRSCATWTETSGKAGDAAVSPPDLLATVNQFGRADLRSLPNCRRLAPEPHYALQGARAYIANVRIRFSLVEKHVQRPCYRLPEAKLGAMILDTLHVRKDQFPRLLLSDPHAAIFPVRERQYPVGEALPLAGRHGGK